MRNLAEMSWADFIAHLRATPTPEAQEAARRLAHVAHHAEMKWSMEDLLESFGRSVYTK